MPSGHPDYRGRSVTPRYYTAAGVERDFPLPPAGYNTQRVDNIFRGAPTTIGKDGGAVNQDLTETDWGEGKDFYLLRWHASVFLRGAQIIQLRNEAIRFILYVREDATIVQILDQVYAGPQATGWLEHRLEPLVDNDWVVQISPTRCLPYAERIASTATLRCRYYNYTRRDIIAALNVTLLRLELGGWLEE